MRCRLPSALILALACAAGCAGPTDENLSERASADPARLAKARAEAQEAEARARAAEAAFYRRRCAAVPPIASGLDSGLDQDSSTRTADIREKP